MIPILSKPLSESRTRNERFWLFACSHFGTISLSPNLDARLFATSHDLLWTVTVPSEALKPMTLSPGIGLQHDAMTYLWSDVPFSEITVLPIRAVRLSFPSRIPTVRPYHLKETKRSFSNGNTALKAESLKAFIPLKMQIFLASFWMTCKMQAILPSRKARMNISVLN